MPSDCQSGLRQFVVQEHHARTHHLDFRLKRDGVFKSWVLPKGIPDQPGIRRLAIQVDDHDLAFGDFSREIPAGQYGAGTIAVWDRGNYECHECTAARIRFSLHGQRVIGTFTMVRFKRGAERNWLIWEEQPQA